MSWLVSLTDESDEEEEVREVTKEEHEVGVVCSMQVGGFPALAKEEAQGLLCEVFIFA